MAPPDSCIPPPERVYSTFQAITFDDGAGAAGGQSGRRCHSRQSVRTGGQGAPPRAAQETETTEQLSPEVEEFARWLFAETGGQPFFLTETLRALLDHGALARAVMEPGTWGIVLRPAVLREVAGGAYVSPEVRDVIRIRLARLSPPAQVLLMAAAVLGQAFDFPRLCRVADLDEKEALSALDEALRAHLLREMGQESPIPSGAYGFSHDKLRDVAYEEAGEARRRIFHRRALETLGKDAAPAELALHALAAGLQEQALDHSLVAGDEAMRVLAARDVIAHYSTAIALAERLGRQDRLTDLHTRRARAYASIGLWADARRELEATIETLRPDEEELRAELLVQLSAAHFWLLNVPSLRHIAGEAIERAKRVGRITPALPNAELRHRFESAHPVQLIRRSSS